MIHSMTAFARAEIVTEDISVNMEVRSVNSRHLDVNVRLPARFMALEERIRATLAKRLTRGRIDIRVQIQEKAAESLTFEVDAGRAQAYAPDMAHFIAGRDFAMSYAGGVSDALNQGAMGSSVLLGRFGTEVAIMAEAGERQQLEQVIGSDDPQAMAVGVAVTDKALLGEELFASGAYLSPEPAFLASVQLQDVLRVVAIVILLLVALLDFIL